MAHSNLVNAFAFSFLASTLTVVPIARSSVEIDSAGTALPLEERPRDFLSDRDIIDTPLVFAAAKDASSTEIDGTLIDSMIVEKLKDKDFKITFWSDPLQTGGSLLGDSFTSGRFNGKSQEPLDIIYEHAHIHLPLHTQYQFENDPDDSNIVTLTQTALIDLSEFRTKFLHILSTTAEDAIAPSRSCSTRLDINSLGLSAHPPDAQGHLKIDIGFLHCMSDSRTGIKTENRLGGGKYEIAMTLTIGIKSGKPVLTSTIKDHLQVDKQVSIMKDLLKGLLAATRPISEHLFGSLESKLDMPSIALPGIDLSAANNALRNEPQSPLYSPKLFSASFVNEEPDLPRTFSLFTRPQTTDRLSLKLVRSQSIRQHTARFIRRQLEDPNKPVPTCGFMNFDCMPNK